MDVAVIWSMILFRHMIYLFLAHSRIIVSCNDQLNKINPATANIYSNEPTATCVTPS